MGRECRGSAPPPTDAPAQPTVLSALPAPRGEGGQGTTVSRGSDDQKCLEPNVGKQRGRRSTHGPPTCASENRKIRRYWVPLGRPEAVTQANRGHIASLILTSECLFRAGGWITFLVTFNPHGTPTARIFLFPFYQGNRCLEMPMTHVSLPRSQACVLSAPGESEGQEGLG